MLDETFAGLGRWPSLLGETAGWAPLVDIEEHDDAYVLEAELPGGKRDNGEIERGGNEFQIGGELRRRSGPASGAGVHAGWAASTTE